jgi:hypothetical protein
LQSMVVITRPLRRVATTCQSRTLCMLCEGPRGRHHILDCKNRTRSLTDCTIHVWALSVSEDTSIPSVHCRHICR